MSLCHTKSKTKYLHFKNFYEAKMHGLGDRGRSWSCQEWRVIHSKVKSIVTPYEFHVLPVKHPPPHCKFFLLWNHASLASYTPFFGPLPLWEDQSPLVMIRIFFPFLPIDWGLLPLIKFKFWDIELASRAFPVLLYCRETQQWWAKVVKN